ncbi:MAG: trypsin-like peptidase domain-containing protein, partial [Aureliella sp.]
MTIRKNALHSDTLRDFQLGSTVTRSKVLATFDLLSPRLGLLALGMLVIGLVTSTLSAQTPTLVGAEEAAFQAAVEQVAASVVQIETFGGLERADEELVADGPTTGTIVAADGWIISTLYSFRQQPASILVTLPGGSRAAARIVARDYSREIALLKVDSDEALPVARFASKADVQVGQWAVALGKTYDKQSVSQSVGIISAIDRAYGKAIQTDAKVSPINYGGPLIDVAGRVIGILSPISPGTFLEGDSSQLYDSGIGFAIPIDDIVARLATMQQGTDIHSGKLGVVSANQNEFVGPTRISGAAPGSPAAKVHMKPGDVIVSAGGHPVTMLAQLKHALGPVDAGQSLSVVVERDGEQLTFEPTLTEEIPIYRRRYLGLRLRKNSRGLLIEDIEPDSPAEKSTLRAGQTITHCND